MATKRAKPHVTVIGCGVSGLTSALLLLESNQFDVTIVAREIWSRTTSAVAGAQWLVYGVGRDPRLWTWADAAAQAFKELATNPDRTGVSVVTFEELRATEQQDSALQDACRYEDLFGRCQRRSPDARLRGLGFVECIDMPLPFINTPRYLRYLAKRFEDAGGMLAGPCELRALRDLYPARRPLVNCAGAWAGALIGGGDPSLRPVRGEVVIVDARLDRYITAEEGPLGLFYIFPRGDGCVLGGTWDEMAAGQTPEEPPVPDTRARDDILHRCSWVEPSLGLARVLAHRAGLRPVRDGGSRLEWAPVDGHGADHPGVIHNYGHGGAGFTLSWGCAENVLEIAKEHWL